MKILKNKKLITKIKAVLFTVAIIAFAVGLTIVGLPQLSLETIGQIVYIVTGSVFLLWILTKQF